MKIEIIEDILDGITNELERLFDKRYMFYYNGLFSQWYLRHPDTDRVHRPSIYKFMEKFVPKGTEFRMWECTHSQVRFPGGDIEPELKEILRKLTERKSKLVNIEVGSVYKMNEPLYLGRIRADKGAVVHFEKSIPACGGYRIIVKPISGDFALTCHSSFFSNSTKDFRGNSDAFYPLDVLKENIGLSDFGESILYDDYYSSKIKATKLDLSEVTV